MKDHKNHSTTEMAIGGGEAYSTHRHLGTFSMGQAMKSLHKGWLERSGDNRKKEENVLPNMHQLQRLGEHMFPDQIRLQVQ